MSVVEAPELRPLSASSLNDLLVCERRWAYARGIDPEVQPGPPNKWLTLGSAVHGMIRVHLDGGNPEDAYFAALQEARDQEGDCSLAMAHASGLFRAWCASPVSAWKPTHQEEEVAFDVEGVGVRGFIDARDDAKIVDWKTSTLPWDDKKAKDAWLQGTLYSLASEILPDKFPAPIRDVRFVVLSYEEKAGYRDRKPGYAVNVVQRHISDADITRLKAMLKVYGPRIQSLDIADYATSGALSSNWLCSQKWCQFYEVCPGGGR